MGSLASPRDLLHRQFIRSRDPSSSAMSARKALVAALRSGSRRLASPQAQQSRSVSSYTSSGRGASSPRAADFALLDGSSMLSRQNGGAAGSVSLSAHGIKLFTVAPRFQQRAGISVAGEGADSHDDFKPVQKDSSAAPSVQEHIEKDIKDNPVMVYMKGVPEAPQCGFSAMVVRILDEYGVEYKTRNVLADPELRTAIKDFSKWPTIPQVYVNGEFLGGSDILISMHRSGELEKLLKDVKKES